MQTHVTTSPKSCMGFRVSAPPRDCGALTTSMNKKLLPNFKRQFLTSYIGGKDCYDVYKYNKPLHLVRNKYVYIHTAKLLNLIQ